jgi:uncharacterized protein with HEPN domain
MRRDDLYLNDIIEAADHIATFLGEMDVEGFRQSELVRSAIVQKLAIIGEAAARISGELTSRYPRIPWPQIVAFRNILIHAYFGIDWNEVWKTAKVDCPYLRREVIGILAKEFGGPAGDAIN